MSNLLLFPTLPAIPTFAAIATAPPAGEIPDSAARAEALDITRSFIVEAPAGSGKTGLLIQRFLKLLASDNVTDPAQVLAITFTRKATNEMLDRVLAQLLAAEAASQPANAFDRDTRPLAEAVLERSARLGWKLLENPHRFNIRTIDSLSGQIARALPLLSGAGGGQSPVDDASLLYRVAARRTLMHLGGPDAALNTALTTLLLHRDGDLSSCEALIADMLGTRDQWGELIPLTQPELSERYLDETVLPALDRALDLAICRALTNIARSFPSGLLDRLTALAAEMACADGTNGNPSPIALCAGRTQPPQQRSEHLEHWQILIDLMLTRTGTFRGARGLHKGTLKFLIEKHHVGELAGLIDHVRHDDALRDTLLSTRSLPPAEYPREQWPVTKALFHVLARALAELKVVFGERSECDFTELALLAREALRSDSALDDLDAGSGLRLEHLLVDEMQDTSSSQYEFIQLLTRHWRGGPQTVFLVGDPKQSIYLFRQARVERFIRTLADAQLGDAGDALPLTVLRLTANFRSLPGLVQSFNDDFTRIFPAAPATAGEQAVPYTSAHAIRTGAGRRVWHADPIDYQADPATVPAQAAAHGGEIRKHILRWRKRPLPPGRTEPWRIAVLVRTRRHLRHTIAALRHGSPIPFRAIEIDLLTERLEIQDLLALTRALLHPADRTAWLALLRSPTCGLSLADLERLTNPPVDIPGHGQRPRETTVFELIKTRGAELSPDAIARLEPFWHTMNRALARRGRHPHAQWVQQTWRELGFASVATPEELTNAETFFQLLDQSDTAGGTVDLAQLTRRMEKLYAAPSTAADAVDLMTIHKAKGLEWDVVFLPEIHRPAAKNHGKLLTWLETEPGEDTENVAAGILMPISGKGRTAHQLTSWMQGIQKAREAAERRRLFYVACTRARQELHLFAAPKRKKEGAPAIPPDSLLAAAWPAAEPHFTAATADLFEMPLRIAHAPGLALAAATAEEPRRTIARIAHPALVLSETPAPSTAARPLHQHLEGSFATRAFGNTLHSFLEQLALRLAAAAEAATLLAEISTWTPRIAGVLRANGLAPAEIERQAASVLRGLTNVLRSPEGVWLLAAHPEAASERTLTTADEGILSTVRLDRTFLAGPEPLAPGESHLWIVDFKTTSHGSGGLDRFLAEERNRHAPQLENYARTLAVEHAGPIRLALFYPMLPHLIWWAPNG